MGDLKHPAIVGHIGYESATPRHHTDQALLFKGSKLYLGSAIVRHEPKGALEIILSALNIDPAIAAAIRPKTTKMSDFESQNWASRFRAETDTLCLSDRLGNIP
jgi:Stf0 sulphotransferase